MINAAEPLDLPIDSTARTRLADQGLSCRRVDAAGDDFGGYLDALNRGFLDPESTPEQVEAAREGMLQRRLVGVYDGPSQRPVGTIVTWQTPLTVSPGHSLEMWAISGVTVAATHRRRGIAREMVTGELRTAADAGLAIAGLTVSEATIYGRFGFGPAVYSTGWTIDTLRTQWVGPVPGGRLDAIDRPALREDLADLHERIRDREPGQIAGWPTLWTRMAGLAPGQSDGGKVRGVRYTDEEGVTRGVVAYSVEAAAEDFTRHTLHVHRLIADGVDAYAALWRFAVEHDLVATVRADLLAGEEPLRWMLSDQRQLATTVDGHHWLRVLDVPAALMARRYRVPLTMVLETIDPLSLAAGTWLVELGPDGSCEVTPTTAEPQVQMPIAALGSILLGGVPASTLVGAGLITAEPDLVGRLDLAFAPEASPRLSLWY